MRRRLIGSTALIALAAVIVLGVPLGLVEAARVREDTTARLEREADAIAGVIDDRLEAHAPIDLGRLETIVRPGHRIIVVTREGRRIVVGDRFTGAALRARAGSALGATVTAEAPTAELEHRTDRVWLLILLFGAGGVGTAVALAAVQARRLGRPLEAVARRSAQLGDGDFSVRAGHFGVPEIDAIAQGLDSSAERIAELVAREREFSANVSHQLRTPLTALRLRLEESRATDDDALRAAELDAALAEADRLERTISDLLGHARRARVGELVSVNLGAVAYDHAGIWRPVFARAGRRLDVATDHNVVVRASPGTAGQVLDVLLDNALDHGAGTVRVEARRDGRAAVLAVADFGAGVAEQDRDRIFERGASRSGGTGIGLHLARALAQADGGALRVATASGSRFELRLRVPGETG